MGKNSPQETKHPQLLPLVVGIFFIDFMKKKIFFFSKISNLSKKCKNYKFQWAI